MSSRPDSHTSSHPSSPMSSPMSGAVSGHQSSPMSGARMRNRLRLLATALLLVALVFRTRPGELLADTKIDLTVAPAAFLGRALGLWDPAQFGQLQNQVSGYLFPMGQFFLGGKLLGLDGWVVQRLWMALLAVTAFAGMNRLAARLGIGTPETRLVAALAFALAPRAVSDLGVLSAEVQPMALLPWILLPLVTAARGGNRMVCTARSAFAVALCGGVNAVAVGAVLVVPVLFVATRDREVRRVRLLAWWLAGVAAATLWWTVPLLLMGRYAFSFLPYTESAATTTQVTSLPNILRGTADWVASITGGAGPGMPVGFELTHATWAAVATCLLAAVGLAGVLRADVPHRLFLTLTLLAGLFVMSAGHLGALESPLAPAIRELIDGPLAPLRNLRKFDPVVRLPLALGIAHVLAAVRRPDARAQSRTQLGARFRARLLTAGVVAALAGITLPVIQLGLAGPGTFREIPGYWHEAARWLNGRAGDQAVLALPGSAFGEYTWGRPLDEPMQQLFTVRWAERQIGAAGSTGLTRVLDAVDRQVAAGRGSPGLREVLARLGVRFLLVRNDLDRRAMEGTLPARVHQALADTGGISRVASFGPDVGSSWDMDDAVLGQDPAYPALEVYEVGGAAGVVSLLPAGDLLRVYGAPEGLLDLADHGLLSGRPTVLNADPGDAREAVVTDSLRRRQRHFGTIRRGVSPTLADGESPPRTGVVDDYLEPGWAPFSATAAYTGIAGVSASSSASDPGTIAMPQSPGRLPYAALDGNPWTMWRSGGTDGPLGQWIRIDFERPLRLTRIGVRFVTDPVLGPPPVRVAVETAAGRVEQDLTDGSGTDAQSLRVPDGPSSWLRLRVLRLAEQPEDASGSPFGSSVGIAEITVPGLAAGRTYRSPDVSGRTAGTPTTYVMTRAAGEEPPCVLGPVRWLCQPSAERQGEEGYTFDHTVTVPAAGSPTLTGRAVLRDAAAIDRYARLTDFPRVSGSSVAVDQPVAAARSAFDGDARTTWISGENDRHPELSIRWAKARTVGRIVVQRPRGARPWTSVLLTAGDGSVRGGWLDDEGEVRFRPVKTDRLRIQFSPAAPPLQVTDVLVDGVRPLPDIAGVPFTLDCGFGPALTIGGERVATRVEGVYGDVLTGRPLRFTSCGEVRVAAGANRIRAVPLDPFRVDSVVLDPAVPDPVVLDPVVLDSAHPTVSKPSGRVSVESWGASRRTVSVSAEADAYLVVGENFNPGWTATVAGRALTAVRIDGWRQAWRVPAGTSGVVRLDYTPDRVYRVVLVAGLAGLLLVVCLATRPVRLRAPRTVRTRAGAADRRLLPAAAAAAGWWIAGPVGLAVVTGCVLAALWGRPVLGRLLRSPLPAVSLPVVSLPVVSMSVVSLLVPAGVLATLSWGDSWQQRAAQLLCLPVVSALLVGLAAPTAAESKPESPGGLLDEEVAQDGDQDRDGHDHEQHRPEPAR
ncbi:DUF3367 domain-containing protein [Microbispora triticiradicis]|uniref:DUF3367 domain-containing protein n=1 Tax=Microbispora triticiradicis TaxID=2200763 RepID=A0ABX9LMY4_9ACTN|nr:DUF3367 domain-containing protein [Microbispora triticiradicis]